MYAFLSLALNTASLLQNTMTTPSESPKPAETPKPVETQKEAPLSVYCDVQVPICDV